MYDNFNGVIVRRIGVRMVKLLPVFQSIRGKGIGGQGKKRTTFPRYKQHARSRADIG